MSMNLENRISNEQLVSRIQSGEDEAENMLKLWEQNRKFITMMARKYAGLAEMEDLEQEGYIGLCEAVRHYEPDKGMKFINYAAFWIKQAMKRYIENTGAVVRIPSNMQDWIRKYDRVLQEYRQTYHEWPSDGAMCWLLDIGQKKLKEIQEAANMGQIRSLDEPIGTEEGGAVLAGCRPVQGVYRRGRLQEDGPGEASADCLGGCGSASGRTARRAPHDLPGRYEQTGSRGKARNKP